MSDSPTSGPESTPRYKQYSLSDCKPLESKQTRCLICGGDFWAPRWLEASLRPFVSIRCFCDRCCRLLASGEIRLFSCK